MRFILPAIRCRHKIKNKNKHHHDHLLFFCLIFSFFITAQALLLCVVPTKSKKENIVPSGNWFGKNYAGALAGLTVVGGIIIVALFGLVSTNSPFQSLL